MLGDELTNPLIASWTTGFIRSILGECLDTIQHLGGKVISVTTDGFITDIDELECKLSTNFLLQEYKKIRMELSGVSTGLELKSRGRGIIAWSTRGQLGIESRIIATTGFQHRVYPYRAELLKGLLSNMKTENKTIEFVQSSLRSASDIYKKGGHVTMQYRDQLFRMHYDNRRQLEWETTIPSSIEVLIDSKPLENINQGRNLRYLSKIVKTKLYGKYTNGGQKQRKYRSSAEIVERNFLKGLLSKPPLFNLHRQELKKYKDIINWLQQYNLKTKVTEDSLAYLQSKVEVKVMKVERTKECENFIRFVKERFKDFDVEEFFN
jgi:hypothetical protein